MYILLYILTLLNMNRDNANLKMFVASIIALIVITIVVLVIVYKYPDQALIGLPIAALAGVLSLLIATKILFDVSFKELWWYFVYDEETFKRYLRYMQPSIDDIPDITPFNYKHIEEKKARGEAITPADFERLRLSRVVDNNDG